MQNKKRKQPRRNKVKYPGLNKKYTTRIRQEFLDFDYIDQLSEKDKEWLNKYVEEELNTQFKNDGTDFNITKEERKKIYDRNNHQNSDLYGNLKNKDNKFSNKKLLNYDNIIGDIETHLSKQTDPTYIENTYIDFIEGQEIEAMLREYEAAMLLFNEVSANQELWQQASQSQLESLEPLKKFELKD